MTNFRNEPHMTGVNRDDQMKRYWHSPISIDHFGTHASIQKNGNVVLSKVASVKGEEVEFDEIEISASLVFKLANLLSATRHTEYVTVTESNKDSNPATENKEAEVK